MEIILIVLLQKALSRLTKLVPLVYRKLRCKPEASVFVVNSYYLCMVNHLVKSGNQLTVVWCINDVLACSHVVCMLFGKDIWPELTMYTGSKFDYLLGMDLKFKGCGHVSVCMVHYLD